MRFFKGTRTATESEADGDDAKVRLERTLILWINNSSHALNHFQNQVVSVLYPLIMSDLGFGYAQLGILSAARSMLGSATQGIYGFVTPFVRRTHLLGLGSIVQGVGTLVAAMSGSFTGFLASRSIAAAGSSAQHPVGSSLLVEYFPKNRGAVLALNNSVSFVGSFLAPLLAGVLLLFLDWRQIFYIVAVLSAAMGVAYFFFRGRGPAIMDAPRSGRAKLAQGKASYLRVLHNRNMIVISLVMMSGAAGRGAGVNMTYLGPHLHYNLGLSVTPMVALALSVLQVGGIIGPLGFGWLSDRVSRKGIIQVSLFLSALGTWWLAFQGAYIPMLFLCLLIYGTVTNARLPLTQALVADSLPSEDLDAAFSIFYTIGFVSGPIWSLLTGFMMERLGFPIAFSVLGFSYLIAMALMHFIEEPARAGAGKAA